MFVVENTPEQHNIVVCTLCSCYPHPVLGLPPVWYKSAPYRSRAVSDPRGVLKDFGVTLPDTTNIQLRGPPSEKSCLMCMYGPVGVAALPLPSHFSESLRWARTSSYRLSRT